GYDNTVAAYTATLGGDIEVRVGDDLLLQSGYGIYAHAQIGHGATNQRLADFTESAISVTAGGDVSVKGGPGIAGAESNQYSFAQIGHGAINADFVDSTGASLPMTSGKGFQGAITVEAGGKLLVES